MLDKCYMLPSDNYYMKNYPISIGRDWLLCSTPFKSMCAVLGGNSDDNGHHVRSGFGSEDG